MKPTTRKKILLASAAAAVMGLGMVSTPAMAFDNVDWNWEKWVLEEVIKDANITIDVAPSGMLELEKLQTQIGDVTATSTVTGFTNNPPSDSMQGAPGPEPAPQIVTIDFSAEYEDSKPCYFSHKCDHEFDITGLSLKEGTTEGVELANGFEGTVDEKDEEIWLTFDLSIPGTEPAPAPGPQPIPIGERDAMDLPKVESIATAVGNNQDIASSVSVELHDGQFLFGDFTDAETLEDAITNVETFLGFAFDFDNTHTELAANLSVAAMLGLIEPATVSADSTVTGILNATVDSDATAVGNNMSVDLAAFTPDDALLIGDVTQFSYADVTATSLVDDVTLEGYTGIGAAGLGPMGPDQIPAVSSTATAVGNNLQISVSSPDTL